MPRNNEDARSGLDRADLPGFLTEPMRMLNDLLPPVQSNSEARTGRKDPRVFVPSVNAFGRPANKHVGFQDQDGNFMNFDEDTAAQKHFAAHGYNKGTAGEMLKKSKARIAESTKAGKSDNQRARKASKQRTAAREDS